MTLSIEVLFVTLGINDTQHNKTYHYAECHYGECHYAECHYAECRVSFVVMLNAILLSVVC
jgi:hypothetical protein